MIGFNFQALPVRSQAEAIYALRTFLVGMPQAFVNQECLQLAARQSTSVNNQVYQFADGSKLDAREWMI